METEQAFLSGPRPSQAGPKAATAKEWERKQRNREYRIAARREKRNRKADEKKQRKLNATILRRMTRNPDKYNKNAERNRLGAIESERQMIWKEAVRQAERLAAIHDPSGRLFNVNAVIKQEDGTVVTQEALLRRQERAAEKAAAEQAKKEGVKVKTRKKKVPKTAEDPSKIVQNGSDQVPPPAGASLGQPEDQRMSKSRRKRLAALAPRPPPPKPVIPEHIAIPQGETDWLALWDLPDHELERRVIREKRRKAAERKALRVKQKMGKAERREARDKKRLVYRNMKQEWKAIKEEQTRERTRLKALEEEESKKIAVEVNTVERKAAMDLCASLGFTLENTEGVTEIEPKALGMRGRQVDFAAIEKGDRRSDIKLKTPVAKSTNSKRVDLGSAPKDTLAEIIPSGRPGDEGEPGEYIHFDLGEGEDFEKLDYNHKLRRKLRRALDNVEMKREELVRERAIAYYKEKDMVVPEILNTPYKACNIRGQRILENGSLETAKQERVKTRMALAEFNKQMRVLRGQAKEAAIRAGLRVHAELMGRIPNLDPEEAATVEKSDANMDMVTVTSPATGSKRTQTEFEESPSSTQPSDDEASNVASEVPSDNDTSESASSISPAEYVRTTKKQRVEAAEAPENELMAPTHSARQAMIDAESALKEKHEKGKGNSFTNGSPALKEKTANAARVAQRPGKVKLTGANRASNWNVQGLPGNDARKSKFMRLLGAEDTTTEINGNGESLGHIKNDSSQLNGELERQYNESVAYKHSKRKGLGS